MFERRAIYLLTLVLAFSAFGTAFADDLLVGKLATPVLEGRVLPEGMRIELSFDDVQAAFEYLIERDTTPEFSSGIGLPYRNSSTSRHIYWDNGITEEMQTLYYRVKALPSVQDISHEESEYSNTITLTPINPAPEKDVHVLINPASLDFQTFVFHRDLVVKNESAKPLKISLWPNKHCLGLSTYGFWLDPWRSKIVEVGLDRSEVEPGLHDDFAVMFLSNAETVGPAGVADGQIDIEAEVAGPVKVADIGPYFLLDETPNGNGLIESWEHVNCQLKLTNTDKNVESLNLTVRILPTRYVASASPTVVHVNNLSPLASTFVPFSFTSTPPSFDCDSSEGPVFDAEFLVLINDTRGYSWEQVVKVGVLAPLQVAVMDFEVDDDDQGVSATVPHTHNKMIECGEIIEGRITFISNYDLHEVSLTLRDDKGFEYLPAGDNFSYESVANLRFIPMCGEVTPDRDFEFRALSYDASPIVFTLDVSASIAPDVAYTSRLYHPVEFQRNFLANGPCGPDVTITTTNSGPRSSVHDGFQIHANLRNLGLVDTVVDLYVGAIYRGDVYYFSSGSLLPQAGIAPFDSGVYLTRKFSGPSRVPVFSIDDVSYLNRGEIIFVAVLQVPGLPLVDRWAWYSMDWDTVNVDY
ncbi:hypothetical protein J7M28_06665 [bacterium]|nr:hypothetical protein [bacterium]